MISAFSTITQVVTSSLCFFFYVFNEQFSHESVPTKKYTQQSNLEHRTERSKKKSHVIMPVGTFLRLVPISSEGLSKH